MKQTIKAFMVFFVTTGCGNSQSMVGESKFKSFQMHLNDQQNSNNKSKKSELTRELSIPENEMQMSEDEKKNMKILKT